MNIVDAQNAALSGGVAVGAISHLMLQPYGAILIGSVSGIISTVGYQIIQVKKKYFETLFCKKNSYILLIFDKQNKL